MAEENNKLNFCECKTLGEFKNTFKQFHIQDFALRDGISYFDVKTSNVDGTIIGEMFDHQIRMKALYENNKKFFNQVDEKELINEAKKKYLKDRENFIATYGVERLEESRKNYGQYYTPYIPL